MTNWREYTITEVRDKASSSGWICFNLNDYVNYKECSGGKYGKEKYMYCENIYPFNSYRKGDVIEINLDKTQHIYHNDKVDSTDIIRVVRKVGSSAVSPYSSGGLSIPTTPSSATEVARTVTQTILDHADRTGGTPQIEIETNKTTFWYHPPKK